jgi:hypothetical protein
VERTLNGLSRVKRRDSEAVENAVDRAIRSAVNEVWGKKPACPPGPHTSTTITWQAGFLPHTSLTAERIARSTAFSTRWPSRSTETARSRASPRST